MPPNMVSVAVHMAFTNMAKEYAGKLEELQKALKESESSIAKLNEHIASQSKHIEALTNNLAKEEQHFQLMRDQYEARLRTVEELNAALKELAELKRKS